MHGNRFLPAALILSAVASPILLQAPAEAQTRVTGRVVNEYGQPVSRVFVQQLGALAMAFTDDQGRFTLTLDATGRRAVEFSAVGYQSRVVAVEALANRPVQLNFVPTYQPTYEPVVPARSVAATPLLDTQVGVSYRLRELKLSHRDRAVEGSIDNELHAHGQLRRGSALLGLEASRFKVPMKQPNLSASATPEVTDVKLRAGLAFGNPFVEIAPSLAVFQQNVTPNNSGVPHSGTLLDFEQTRRGVGLSLPAALSIGKLELLGEASWSPWTWTTLTNAPYSVGNTLRFDWKAGLGYRVSPVVRAELTYTNQEWYGGAFEEKSDVWSLGVTYRPERREGGQ